MKPPAAPRRRLPCISLTDYLVIHAVVLEELDCLVSLEKLEILKVLEEY